MTWPSTILRFRCWLVLQDYGGPGAHIFPRGFAMANAELEAAWCADTVSIISDWSESLEILRMTPTYDDSGMASESWTLVGAFIGDWQPVSAATMRAEAGLSVRTSSVVFGPCDLDVVENDRIQKDDGTFEYVNFSKQHEEHIEIYLKRDKGSK